MERREDLRAADADRQLVGDRLREALNEGRLDLSEYDERLQQAYAARTYGELDKLLTDLPPVTPAQASRVATTKPPTPPAAHPVDSATQPAGQSHNGKGWLAGVWGGWLSASLITTAIWSVSALSGNGVHSFWPIWVIVPFGAVCLATTIRRLAGDDSADMYRRRDRSERRERRRNRYR